MIIDNFTYDVLKNCFLFSDINKEEIIKLLSQDGIEQREYAVNEKLLEYNSSRKELGIIISGEAGVYKPLQSKDIPINIIESDAIYGVAMLFCNESAATEIIARQKCRVLIISQNALKNMMQINDKILENYIGYMSDRIHFLVSRVGTLSEVSVESKVLGFLMNNSHNNICFIKQSMTSLAATLGISRASLYRILDVLENKGLILREDKTIKIMV